MDKNSYNNWLDYAAFNLLIDDYSRCEECLKECISINQNEITGYFYSIHYFDTKYFIFNLI